LVVKTFFLYIIWFLKLPDKHPSQSFFHNN
jgi:hypothetical protein